MIEVVRYTPADAGAWDNFLATAKNQTFLLSRTFMDCHQDRFKDHSLLVYDSGRLAALLPAHIDDAGEVLSSHKGLSYGGFIVPRTIRSVQTIAYFYEVLRFLSARGVRTLDFKQIPSFYNSIPGEELDYAFFLLGAVNYRTDIAMLVVQQHRLAYQERRSRSIKKAVKLGAVVSEESDFSGFWQHILEPNLRQRFGVAPVHTLAEITQLAQQNPGQIRQFNASVDGTLMAGCTIFETETTAHAQYISASDEGRRNGALDLLFHELISRIFAHKTYFDFGVVNENGGLEINAGLLDWKEGFGGRACAHRFYRIQTAEFRKLGRVLPPPGDSNSTG